MWAASIRTEGKGKEGGGGEEGGRKQRSTEIQFLPGWKMKPTERTDPWVFLFKVDEKEKGSKIDLKILCFWCFYVS